LQAADISEPLQAPDIKPLQAVDISEPLKAADISEPL
jgi:hypothetical protein